MKGKMICFGIVGMFLILHGTSVLSIAKTEEIIQNDCGCEENDEYLSLVSYFDGDYACGIEDLTHRNMETWICDNLNAGSKHNPCWCHIGMHTYFVGKDGLYSFSTIEGVTCHTEMCGLGNPGTEDMSICNKFHTWPIDGEPWKPASWQWYLETSIDGIHWELVSKYPFNKIKEATPFGPTSISSISCRFVRFRMPMDIRGIGLAGYMDNTNFVFDEVKTKNIGNEGYMISRIQGSVSAHKYRSMDLRYMLVQVSYDGTTDWNTIHEFGITDNEQKSFDVTLETPTLTRFIRIIPKSDLWNEMPATPAFVDYSSITVTHSQGTLYLSCENDTMECTLSPLHPCYSGGQGYNDGYYNTCENYMMSGSFQHTYPLLSKQISNDAPSTPSQPYGLDKGEQNQGFDFSTNATDPNGDELYYMFDWDADDLHHLIPWQGPYDSGQTVTISHMWDTVKQYSIRVKVKDKYGFESEWSEKKVFTVAKSKNTKLAFNNILLKLLDRFPILQTLLRQSRTYEPLSTPK